MIYTITYVVIFAFMVYGLYQMFLGAVIKEPIKLSGTKMLGKIQRQNENKDIWKQRPFVDIVSCVSKHIYVQPSKQRKLENQLVRTGMNYTPAEYVARSYCAAGAGLLMTLVSILASSSTMVIICLLATVYLYLKNSVEVSDKVKKENEIILAELPQFTKTIEASIQGERDIIKIIQRYTKIAGPEFRRELEILLLEMNTGNIQTALQNFDNRLDMIEVSRLTRALINIERGVDQGATLTLLANDMNLLAREHNKMILAKRPGKMRRAMLPAGAVMVVSLFYVFAEQAILVSKTF